jgi:hypothetical protein
MKKIASNKWGRLLLDRNLWQGVKESISKVYAILHVNEYAVQKVLWFPGYNFLRNDAFYFLKETYHMKLLGFFFGLWIFHFFVLFNGIRRNAC